MFDTAAKKARIASGKFQYLMGLYAENYWRLVNGFGPDALAVGRYESDAGDGLDLIVDVIEKHPYTTEMRLSYRFHDDVTGTPDPSAYVRLYRDARLAEVTHCYVGARLEDVLGRFADPKTIFDHRLRMNSFLSKWLEYLADRGHSRFTLKPALSAAA